MRAPAVAARFSDAGADTTSAPNAPQPGDLEPALTKELALEQRFAQRLLLDRQRFDLASEQRAEWLREQEAIRDMMMAQLKDEDAYLKKWIELI